MRFIFMNIVLVIATLKQGGAERVMSELANNWESNNHKIDNLFILREILEYFLFFRGLWKYNKKLAFSIIIIC